MSRLADLRTVLTTRVFNSDLGTDITITPQSIGSSSDGGFTPGTTSNGTATTVKGIPYSNTTARLFQELAGNFKLGEGAVVLPYNTTITTGDKAAWLSKTYHVVSVEDIPLGGGVAVKIAQCNERN